MSRNYKNCNIKIRTLECNPSDKNLWTQQLPLNEYGDNNEVIKSNIINGCWECNYEDSYEDNNYLYNRSLYNGYEPIPYNYTNDVILNSQMLNITKPRTKHLPPKGSRPIPISKCQY